MKRRRRFITVIGLLVAGAALNVAVAWGCAIGKGDTNRKLLELSPNLSHEFWRRNAPPEFPVDYSDKVNPYTQSMVYRLTSTWRCVIVDVVSDAAMLSETYTLGRADYGLPMRSMYGVYSKYRAIDANDSSSTTGDQFHHYVDSPIQFTAQGLDAGKLPIGIDSAGFAINTLFYAAVCWLLFFAPFALRRRLRRQRGLCSACAYPVGASAVCTECGARL